MRLEKHTNSLIDFSQPLSFVFNNKAYKGFKGDTLASALIANDVLFYARSFPQATPTLLMAFMMPLLCVAARYGSCSAKA